VDTSSTEHLELLAWTVTMVASLFMSGYICAIVHLGILAAIPIAAGAYTTSSSVLILMTWKTKGSRSILVFG
jgi:hypothetical protein